MKKANKKVKGGFDYDLHNDTVFFYSEKSEYSQSKTFDNFVIDFDKDNQIIAMEILNASEVLKVPKYTLKHINEVTINMTVDEKIVSLLVVIKSTVRNAERQNTLSVEKINSDLLNPMQSQLSIA